MSGTDFEGKIICGVPDNVGSVDCLWPFRDVDVYAEARSAHYSSPTPSVGYRAMERRLRNPFEDVGQPKDGAYSLQTGTPRRPLKRSRAMRIALRVLVA